MKLIAYSTLAALLFTGCTVPMSYSPLKNAKTSQYACLKPKYQTVLHRQWDTCPFLFAKPNYATPKWELSPIISDANREWLALQAPLQQRIHSGARGCSVPSLIDHIIYLESDDIITVSSIRNWWTFASGNDFYMSGTVKTKNSEYEFYYSGIGNESDNGINYDITKYFDLCK